MPHGRLLTLAAVLLLGSVGGCAASNQDPTIHIPAGDYAAAFDAARDEIRKAGYELQRVDARAGVITSQPRASAGLATPWTGVESSFEDAWQSLVNHERRRLRIEFRPEAVEPPPTDAAPDPRLDLREAGLPVELTVTAEVERAHRPGMRVQPASVRLTSFSRDLIQESEGVEPTYWTVISEDKLLAMRIADRIRNRLAAAPAE
ncbi:MAG: hypothetical protein VYC34_07925 [Planctomycetota bacterium]|nr:hypothetical protein [Planctomycetota bacterium]